MLEGSLKGVKYPSEQQIYWASMTLEECKQDECRFIEECWYGKGSKSEEVEKEG
jgi:hypothetical protein